MICEKLCCFNPHAVFPKINVAATSTIWRKNRSIFEIPEEATPSPYLCKIRIVSVLLISYIYCIIYLGISNTSITSIVFSLRPVDYIFSMCESLYMMQKIYFPRKHKNTLFFTQKGLIKYQRRYHHTTSDSTINFASLTLSQATLQLGQAHPEKFSNPFAEKCGSNI